MSMLDLLLVLVSLVVVIVAHLAITPFALAVLVGALVVERFLKGERL